jgi:hypothetical protein
LTLAVADEQKALLHVLRILHSQGEDWMRHKRAPGLVAARVAENKFDAIAQHELNNHFLYQGKAGQFGENKVIWIKPPAKDPSAVAGIWCRWNYEKTLPKCGFYYGLWSERPPFPTVDSSATAKHPAFVGYRFETPEEGNNHNFYHAQPCRSMNAKDDPVEQSLPISEREPTWPLAATTALELLLCMVTSLYGMSGLSELLDSINADGALRQNVPFKSAVDNLLALKCNAD